MTKTKRSRRLGQTMMEFVLIICLVAAAVSGAVYLFGDKIKKAFETGGDVVAESTKVGQGGASDIGPNTPPPSPNKQ
ncbi:MAG: Flp family type IVb pilin [Candidatus Spyradenecus sp.]